MLSDLESFIIIFFTDDQEHMSRDDARQHYLRVLRLLPYGNSVFFSARKIEDPIGLLPGRIILGINKRGVCSTILHQDNKTMQHPHVRCSHVCA